MSPGHERWADAAGAYVLGAMAPDEREKFEGHLATCATCREDVDELRPAAEALPMGSPPMLAPAGLKDRIMAEVEREAALLAQAGGAADRPERARRRVGWAWLSGWRLAPVAAALLIVGALAGAALSGGGETRTVTAAVDRAQAEGASAEVRIDGDSATLVAQHLPMPPNGRVYEVWVMPKGSDRPRPTDVLFLPRSDGSAAAAVPGDISGAKAVLVTHEPPGGSNTPTKKPLLTADVS